MRVTSILLVLAAGISQGTAQSTCPLGAAGPFAGMAVGPVALTYAKQFSLEIVNAFTATVTVSGKQITLAACNGPASPSAIMVPVSSVSVQQTAVVGFLERLGKLSTVSSIDKQYATSDCALNLPTTAASNAAVTFGSASGNVDVAAAILSEASPLAMAEWMLFFDAFYAGTGNGKTVFDGVVSQYQCLAGKVQKYRDSNEAKYGTDPVVVISASDFKSNAVIAPTNIPFWRTVFTDAGGVPVIVQDASTFASMAHNADAVFDATFEGATEYNIKLWSTIHGGLTPTSRGYPFLNGFMSQVWRFDERAANGYDDFYQSSPAQPDLLLADLIQIFDSDFNTAYNPFWLRNLANSATYTQSKGSNCAGRTAFSQYFDGKLCPARDYVPNVGRLEKPASLPSSNTGGSSGSSNNGSTVSSGSLTAGVVGGIAGGVAAGLIVVCLGVWCIGKRRAKAGLDERDRGSFAWVSDAAANRRFVRIGEENDVGLGRVDDAEEGTANYLTARRSG
ncbi:hypothetical protein HDU81_005653 [Chytriomyces hyalinus]|nr:hypothetical protein HDU81_005653 [Chytriomyces hyalinus]